MKIRCMNCMRTYEDSQKACPRCGFVRGTKPKEIWHLYPEMELMERYVIGTVVGFGGFGILYRAWDSKLEHMVAIKEYYPAGMVTRIPGRKAVIPYTGKKSEEFKTGKTRFLDEARTTARFIDNANIVNVYDFFEENGTAYMVMEYLEGMDLKKYIAREGGKLPWEQALEICSSVIDALKDVHQTGVLHRDIAPDNIFICQDGTIKLLDFGAAFLTGMDDEKTRQIELKIGFAPPEQYRKKSRQGPWTDIYALGATLYKIITGVTPDESVNRAAAIGSHEGDTLEPVSKLEPEVPGYVDKAIFRAMALEPELRFQNVSQMKAALFNQGTVLDPQEEIRRRKRRRNLGIGAAAAVLAVAGAGTFGLLQSRRQLQTLRGVSLQVWMPVQEALGEEGTEELFHTMSREFLENYPDVELELTCYPADEYEAQILEASQDGQLPDLFESSGLGDELAGQLADPQREVFDLLDGVNAPGLISGILTGERRKTLETGQVPLGFETSVLFVNTRLEREQAPYSRKNDEEGFFAGESRAWVTGVSEFVPVQDHLAGLYQVQELEESSVPARYTQLWSIGKKASRVERTAAGRLLYFFLRQPAQEALHLQNDTALPVNDQAFQTYLQVNRELDFLKDVPEKAEFVSFEEMEAANEEIYKKIKSE